MNWPPMAPRNNGHRGFNDVPMLQRSSGSTFCEIGLDQAPHPLLESSLQLRQFVVKDGKHDSIANVTGPGKTVPAQDTFPDSAKLGHSRLAALVTRIDLELNTHRTAVKGVVQHQQFLLRIGGPATDRRVEERGSDRYAAVLAQKLGVISRHPDHPIIAA